MQIEAGKYYRTRDGRKVGPMERDKVDGKDWREKDNSARLWYDDGTRWICDEDSDLIAEWVDEPTQPTNAALAAKYGICITVKIGSIEIIYDGRKAQ